MAPRAAPLHVGGDEAKRKPVRGAHSETAVVRIRSQMAETVLAGLCREGIYRKLGKGWRTSFHAELPQEDALSCRKPEARGLGSLSSVTGHSQTRSM